MSKEQNGSDLPGFSFCLLYYKFDAEESGNTKMGTIFFKKPQQKSTDSGRGSTA